MENWPAGKMFKILASIITPVAVVVFVLFYVILPNLSLEKPVSQPLSTIIIIFSISLIISIALVIGAGLFRNDFYVNRIENDIERLEGIAPKLGILRDRDSLHQLRAEKKWVIGAKLNYPNARINNILEALQDGRLLQISFLCIDTEYTDLKSNIQFLMDTLKSNYGDDSKKYKQIAARICIREISPSWIQFPMDIYDPYVDGRTRVAVYFPHSKEFIGTSYDMGFLIINTSASDRDPTAYFVEKAEQLWRHSTKTIWSEFKKELGIEENWNEVCYLLKDLKNEKKEEIQNVYRNTAIEFVAEVTGLSIAAVEDCVADIKTKP